MSDYIIVGSDGCKINDVADTMLGDSSSEWAVSKYWSDIAMRLDMGLAEIDPLRLTMTLGMKNLKIVLVEILTKWQIKNNEKATLAKLLDVLKALQLNLIADSLKARFLTAAAVIQQEENQCLKNLPLQPFAQELDLDVLDGFVPNIVKECFGIRKQDSKYPVPSGGENGVLLLSINNYLTKSRAFSTVTVDQRDGAWEDCAALKAALMKRGYLEDDIQVENDADKIYTKQDIIDVVDDFRNVQQKRPIRSLIVFLGGHGFYGFLQSGTRENIDLYNDIIYKFDSTNAHELTNIPKVFIFQACQGMRIPEHVPNPLDAASNALALLPMDNTMVCLAALPGYPAIRDPYGSGSAYVLTLVHLLNHKAEEMDLSEMLEEAKRLTAEKADAFARKAVEKLRNQNPVNTALINRLQNFRQVPVNYSIGTFGKLKFVN